MNKPTIKAKRISLLYADSKNNRIMINIIDEFSKPKSLPVSREFAVQARQRNLSREYRYNYTFFLDKPLEDGGVVVAVDLQPKNGNVPTAVGSEGAQDQANFVILERCHGNIVLVRRNNGGVAPAVVEGMKDAVQAAIDEGKEVKAYDILAGGFYVRDVRENGRYIHVELSN